MHDDELLDDELEGEETGDTEGEDLEDDDHPFQLDDDGNPLIDDSVEDPDKLGIHEEDEEI